MVDRVHNDVQVLIADDDPAFRITIVELLDPYFRTIDVQSGEEALEVVERAPVNFALFDLHMHLLTGLETVRKLRADDRHVPWILMSSDINTQIESEALTLEAACVLRKPPRRIELLDTIRNALKL